MKIYLNKKPISVSVEKTDFFGKIHGLMFRTSKTNSLLFEFKQKESYAIHSFFVFFPFLALWLDEKNNVKEYNFVKPFTFLIKPQTPPRKLIEIPLNEKNNRIIKLFVDKRKSLNSSSDNPWYSY
jgi:uncharacterized membrane protein (UPF0127 family)